MGLPAKRRTTQSKKERNSHIKAKKQGTMHCPQCKKAVLPHVVCASCGTYRGKNVINTQKRVARASRKIKA